MSSEIIYRDIGYNRHALDKIIKLYGWIGVVNKQRISLSSTPLSEGKVFTAFAAFQ